MAKEEILSEMVRIYKKYFKVIESIGTISMSTQDKERLSYLEAELNKV